MRHLSSLLILALVAVPVFAQTEQNPQSDSAKESPVTGNGAIGVKFLRTNPQLNTKSTLVISAVTKDGPADKAGLKPGDIIISFDGREFGSSSELAAAIRTKEIGSKVKVDFMRGTNRSEVVVAVAAWDKLLKLPPTATIVDPRRHAEFIEGLVGALARLEERNDDCTRIRSLMDKELSDEEKSEVEQAARQKMKKDADHVSAKEISHGQEQAPQTPPQKLLDEIRKGWGDYCKQKEPGNADCVTQSMNSQKYQRFGFRSEDMSRIPPDSDFGWLVEEKINDCEAKEQCGVAFYILWNGDYQAALRYNGNLQSLKYGSHFSSGNLITLHLNEYTLALNTDAGQYYDEDAYFKQQAKEEKAEEAKEQRKLNVTLAPLRKAFGELGLHRLQSQEQVKTLLLSHGFGPWQCGTKQDISVVSGYSTTCLASRNKGRPDQDNVLLMFGDTIHEHRDADSGIVRVDSVERVLLLARYARENDEVEAKFGDDNEPF